MQKLVEGVHRFQETVYGPRRELFERLAGRGQAPEALFITCSDSRINPNELTQTGPGELFILRNAGNLVPMNGPETGGEGATIEFAVAGLGVRDIIVCGHTLCGAMDALMSPHKLESLPFMRSWLRHAQATRQIMSDHYSHVREPEARLRVAIEENVLVQLENLRTHPVVANGLASGKLALHGWVYKLETGEVFAYDATHGQFVSVADAPSAPAPRPPSSRLTKPDITI